MHRQRIVSDPNVMMGKPVIAGTRIPVELILEKLSAGETVIAPGICRTRRLSR